MLKWVINLKQVLFLLFSYFVLYCFSAVCMRSLIYSFIEKVCKAVLGQSESNLPVEVCKRNIQSCHRLLLLFVASLMDAYLALASTFLQSYALTLCMLLLAEVL